LPQLFLTDNEVKFLGIILPRKNDTLTKKENIDLQSINLKVDKLLLKKGSEVKNGKS